MTDREQFKAAARAAAWSEGSECPTCNGDGKVPGGRDLIHSLSPHGFGADWDLEGVLDAIEKSPRVLWVDSKFGHDLVIEIDDRDYRFQVVRPSDEVPS